MIPHMSLVILVFGFVFAIVMHAWFVRRTARLTSTLQDRRDTHKQLTQDVAQLGEEVMGFRTAIDSNTVSIAGLEREIEGLQQNLEETAAEMGVDPPKIQEKKGSAESSADPAVGHEVSAQAATSDTGEQVATDAKVEA